MPAYVIAQMKVHDPVKYREYASKLAPTAAPYNGRILAANDAEPREGEPAFRRTIIGEFPSLEQLRAWYESPAYQQILPLRLQSTTSILFFVEGFTMPAVTEEP
ncbi:MAG: DUF1330 domain-containing protein [Dehalococcoidia bacterium]